MNGVDVMFAASGDKQYHIGLTKEQVGGYVIMPGDPGRVPKIAAYLDKAEFMAQNREYTTYTGYLSGEKVSVTSTGIGGPSAAIAIEELVKCGAHTFIRVGTSGGMKLDVVGGDLVIATAAIRGDGTSHEYLTPDYPAVADFTVVDALRGAAVKNGLRHHIGVVQTKDSFYGETDPDSMPIADYLNGRWAAYLKAGCLASEMEAAALFAVGLTRNVRVGCVLTAIWNVERAHAGLDNPEFHDSSRAITCAVEAIKSLIGDGGSEKR